MDEDHKVAKGRPGLWAVLGVIFGLSMGGRAITAVMKGELNIPFMAKVVQAHQPVAFYCVVVVLAALAILCLLGGYFYWQEWRAAKKAA